MERRVRRWQEAGGRRQEAGGRARWRHLFITVNLRDLHSRLHKKSAEPSDRLDPPPEALAHGNTPICHSGLKKAGSFTG
ncbi:hypothetical protein EYF80_040394 [Liparis tanakae]|uniref:Uncharacterized protein n=1 Tax=Liparis tanakae TaxID=230148 RepID=A0A4Z2GA16_9TELE|nr:hypothetical protein EYF80_040394 [Liparis tanakae]